MWTELIWTELNWTGLDWTGLDCVTAQRYSAYAQRVLHGGLFNHPDRGRNNDEAHPPIHPTRSVSEQDQAGAHNSRV